MSARHRATAGAADARTRAAHLARRCASASTSPGAGEVSTVAITNPAGKTWVERRPHMSRGAQRSDRYVEPSGWVGWIIFAGAMMIMLGFFHAIAGLVALFKDDYFLVKTSGLVVNVDYTTWGWVHLIL